MLLQERHEKAEIQMMANLKDRDLNEMKKAIQTNAMTPLFYCSDKVIPLLTTHYA